MNRFRSFTVGALVLGLLSGAAYAQGVRGGDGRGQGRLGGPGLALRALNLTEAQQQQVQQIREQHRDEVRAAEAQVRSALTAQRRAIETVPYNEGLIRSTTQELAEAQTAAALLQARVFNETWAVLTPAQQEQAKKLQAERATRTQQQRQRFDQRRRG